ncbi:MAG TPA: hypothetical protein VI583_10265, partial [Cyclobacteriaceae bacterium]|nr:hypothetical protein [Cyclobacteriaceae bacterium]
MKKIVSTGFIILILYFNCFPQIFDDFADGEYTNNPVKWEDPAGSYVASDGMLSLSAATGTEKAYIRTKSNYSKEAGWEFRIKLDFNPSAYNYAEIYLTADGPDLDGHVNGHFVRIGGARDEISLFRRDGFPDQVIKLIDGPDGMTDLDLVNLRIRATVAIDGIWQLSVSDASDNHYIPIGSGVDPDIPSCNYFGILCFFTPSRNDKFHFDDIRITGMEIAD